MQGSYAHGCYRTVPSQLDPTMKEKGQYLGFTFFHARLLMLQKLGALFRSLHRGICVCAKKSVCMQGQV